MRIKTLMQYTGNILAAAVVVSAAARVGAHQAKNNAPRKQVIGNFSLENTDLIDLISGPTRVDADLTGPKLVARTPEYELAAPRIKMVFEKAKGRPLKATIANATGGVRAVVRSKEAGQTTNLTCTTAVYRATTNPADKGRLDLKGKVHSVTYNRGFSGPIVQDSESGYIEFLDADRIHIVMEGAGSISGTPIEPAPKKKP